MSDISPSELYYEATSNRIRLTDVKSILQYVNPGWDGVIDTEEWKQWYSQLDDWECALFKRCEEITEEIFDVESVQEGEGS